MITDHNHLIPESADPGSMAGEAHNLTDEPPITTALLLDPTGPGYRLDSKLVAELTAPLPKTKFVSFLRTLPFLLLTFFLLGTLVLYSDIATHERNTTPGGTEDLTSTQKAWFSTTTSAPRGVKVDIDTFLQLDHVQATPPNFGPKVDTKPSHQRWRMHKVFLGFSAFCNIVLMFFLGTS